MPVALVWFFAPPLLLAIPGVFRLAKRNIGLAIVAGVTPIIYLLFFARYTQWEGGYCVGPRYLVPAITLLCLGLGPIFADAKPHIRKLAAVLFAAGMLVQVVSIATSFMEDQVPRGRYYDANWTYRLGYSLSGQIHLLLKYLESGEPARLGLGWDRWFVFLHKGGVAAPTLAVLGLAMLAGLGLSLAGLARNVRSAI